MVPEIIKRNENKTFSRALENVPEETHTKIREVLDMMDRNYHKEQLKIIDEAYELYMPQVRFEIEEFYQFINDHYDNNTAGPYNVLEIGTKFGGTFYLWCVMNQSSGLNISIDMNDGGVHGGIDEKKMDQRDEWFKDRFENSRFIRGNSHDENCILEILSMTHLYDSDSDVKFLDFVFIDGDHTYEGVKQDFDMYSPFVKKGGLICFHDIKDTQRHRDRQVEVGRFWNEIKDQYTHYEFIDSDVDWGGIGCLIRL